MIRFIAKILSVPLPRRVAIGEITGFSFALVGVVVFPQFYETTGALSAVGVTIYYVLLGAFVGMVGIFTKIPHTPIRYRWWWRGAVACGFANLGILLMFMNSLTDSFSKTFGTETLLSSPWMFVIEGAVFGLICEYLCTRFAGEGRVLFEGFE